MLPWAGQPLASVALVVEAIIAPTSNNTSDVKRVPGEPYKHSESGGYGAHQALTLNLLQDFCHWDSAHGGMIYS